MGMKKEMRGRPRLGLTLLVILRALRKERTITGAARVLRCSAGYIHGRLREEGLSLQEVLEANSLNELTWELPVEGQDL